jgi:uncharacterized protein (TIGR03663 family)
LAEKVNRFWQTCLILLIGVAVAMPLRWANLAQRPFHADESVQAMKFRTLWNTGEYKYNPDEFHGPSLHYFSLPFQWLCGQDIDSENEAPLRSVPAFFSLLAILCLFCFRSAFGRSGLLVAALLLALSPSLLFYSRYFIHEVLLFTFTLLFLASAWQYTQTLRRRWALLCGIALGLMYATKETFVFNVAASFGALFFILALEKFKGTATTFLKQLPRTHWFIVLGGFLVTGILFFTSFFTNRAGPLDSILTYFPWMTRAGGESPHIWPWYFYLQRYFWFTKDSGPLFSELFLFIPAGFGVWAGFKDHFSSSIRRLSLFLSAYTLLLAAIYCIIPYKTPWCFIVVIQGLILLAGIGTHYLFTTWKSWMPRLLISLVFLGGFYHLFNQGRLMNEKHYEESKNPHVYAHTISDVRGLIRTVEKISSIHPDGNKMIIQVITRDGDCWPLPWYLRVFDDTTGWYTEVPDNLLAPVVIYSPRFSAEVKEKLKSPHQFAGFYGFRPSVFLQLSVEKNIWNEYVEKGLARDDDDDD